MQIKTLTIFALAVACASAENATYIGCYTDQNAATCGTRDLPTFFCSNGKSGAGCCAGDPGLPAGAAEAAGVKAMTLTTCSSLCRGFKFFGVQDGGWCFCGNDYGNQGGKAPESDCNQPCSGDSSTMCGGGGHNSVYAQPPSMYNATTSSH
jgi:hypothetical protein